ncbi:hypothetical protein [Alkaliphilus sp. B6464]|uniref:hypothetical protein n=1 Tax=Alkaliphilus sp. B6464 TaxID=2731219 RepID=UPI001BA7E63E|nr:hypothetical protein [Alkaliphilus sp. B6464]QUH21763.1 hypothetical protein HYG84_17660 [Alkaliphilus sp. B6464]
MKRMTIKVPKIDLEKLNKERYEKNSKNKNNLSYWFSMIKDCGFKVPETHIIPINFELFKWLTSDNYSDEMIDRFNDFIISELKKNNFNTERTLFLKTGTFSDKFTFKNCKLTDINRIGYQFLQIFYSGILVGANNTNELVVREFIKSDPHIKTIYDGMPLNTEFRVFYDFDKDEVMGVFNYWDRKTMIDSLGEYAISEKKVEEFKNFRDTIPVIEKEFEDCKDFVVKEVEEKMKNVDLNGQWSIDLMKIGNDFYLIDMAMAKDSYYYDKIIKQTGKINRTKDFTGLTENIKNLITELDMTENEFLKILDHLTVSDIDKLSYDHGDIFRERDIESLFDYMYSDSSEENVNNNKIYTEEEMRAILEKSGYIIPMDNGGLYFIYRKI